MSKEQKLLSEQINRLLRMLAEEYGEDEWIEDDVVDDNIYDGFELVPQWEMDGGQWVDDHDDDHDEDDEWDDEDDKWDGTIRYRPRSGRYR